MLSVIVFCWAPNLGGEDGGFHIEDDPTPWACPVMAVWAWMWWDASADRYFRWGEPRTLTAMAMIAGFGLPLGVLGLWSKWELVLQAV